MEPGVAPAILHARRRTASGGSWWDSDNHRLKLSGPSKMRYTRLGACTSKYRIRLIAKAVRPIKNSGNFFAFWTE